ncbi:MAG: aminotransferase class IV [Nitrospinae bacterium]|nr:aminotransferase class IV [Nitrospinota bacterium]
MEEPIVYINGIFTRLGNAKVSILDRGFCYGDGLFETLRANKGKIFRLEQHINRLLISLPKILIDLPMTRLELMNVVQETLNRNKFKNAIIRLAVTRGVTHSNIQIDSDIPPTIVINIRPFIPPNKAIYKKGIRIKLFQERANHTNGLGQRLKSCNYLSNILIKELSERNNFMEGVIVDPDFGVTEGTTSNIFLVKSGVLKTPPLSPYVLAGITRQVVLDIAKKHKIPFLAEPLTTNDLINADEVFITNSGFEVVPVTQIDSQFIGNKKPGILTQFFHAEFLKCVEAEKNPC